MKRQTLFYILGALIILLGGAVVFLYMNPSATQEVVGTSTSTPQATSSPAASSTEATSSPATSSEDELTEEEVKEIATDDSDGTLYVEVTDACGPYYGGGCLNVRAGTSTDSETVAQLRDGQVLKVDAVIETPERTWYKVAFDEWVRYPDRITEDWFVAGEFVRTFRATPGDWAETEVPEEQAGKRLVVDLSEQKLYAYEDDELFLETDVSTGLDIAPTPGGYFSIFYKTPSRYMQGPIPDITTDDYDLPGVPWNLYFTRQGAVIHGAYWHDKFGQKWSHGCVNVDPEVAKELYFWTPEGADLMVRQ